MGYRERNDIHDVVVWMKPVGYHLFTCQEDSRQWENWFLDIEGKLSLYHSETLPEEDTLSYLKQCEAYTRISVGNGTSQFQLSAYRSVRII
jgi:hypothetical protein